MNQDTFFPQVGDFYCESASKIFGTNGDGKPLREIVFKLKRMKEEVAIKLQHVFANLPEDDIEKAAQIQIEKSKEVLTNMIVGWSGFDAEYNHESLEACIDQMPTEVKIEIALAGATFSRTGIMEDKRSKNETSSPSLQI